MTRPAFLDARGSLELGLSGINLIEASAGTGKTYTIANLYLRHILEGRKPAEILVVSFTNAATDELHQRIHARLYQAWEVLKSGQAPQDEFLTRLLSQQLAIEQDQQHACMRRIQSALRSMDEAMISTIHGFCHSALQDHALLSNCQFETQIVANDDDYWEAALKDWWRRSCYPLGATAWALFSQAIPGLKELLRWHRQLRSHPRDRLLPVVETALTDLLIQHAELDHDAQAQQNLLRKIKSRALTEAHEFAQRQVAAQKQAQARLAYQDQLDLLLKALEQDDSGNLAQRLRTRFPVAMIDEFQDTDDVQFRIFQLLYFSQNDVSLTLIGDPKQAIYSFRGGDIFTYIKARQHPDISIYALHTNWRSQPGLVNAVNHIFGNREQAFIFDEAIAFSPAQSSPLNDSAWLSIDDQPTTATTLWRIPLRENGKTLLVGDARQRLNQAVVSEIARLLDSNCMIQDHVLQCGDIAVLVRERDEGEELRACLATAGIGSVTIGRETVFASREAQGLYDLVEGIAHPTDDRCLRRARASALFSSDYLSLAEFFDNDKSWQRWSDQIISLHQTWLRNGFITMFQQMLENLDPATALARQTNAERRLTNLTHLAELLQQQSRTSPGIDALISWFQQQMNGGSGDEAELRLESDAELVKIVTVHKSKGLEYPVVFLPFMWRCKLATKGSTLLRYHDDDHLACIDLGSEEFEQHGFIAEKERLAEDLRLLYVALTRARSKLYLAWGDVGDGRSKGQPKHSALAYLLHSIQSPTDLNVSLPMGFDNSATMFEDLHEFAQGCDDIEIVELPDDSPNPQRPGGLKIQKSEAREFKRVMGPAWRINSFSSLTRDVHQTSHQGERICHGDAILDFPAGSHIGLLVHLLLEHLDFQQDIGVQGKILIEKMAPAYGVTGREQLQTLNHWLELIVSTALDRNGLQLVQIDNSKRLNEIKFDFALDHFNVEAVNGLLQQTVEQPLQPISATEFRGLLTGVIDLVFEYRGKYYLADYKSNHLGSKLTDYAPQNLARAMLDRRYDLQALLYSVAMHRYLQQRLPDYSYTEHFGGCYYLFLRAMRPDSGCEYGVHFECPAQQRLDALQQLLAFTPHDPVVV